MSAFKYWALVALAVPAGAELKIAATTTDLAALARAVGGEAVEVHSIARPGQDPHYVEAKPSYIRQVHEADLLVAAGLQLEIGWLPLLIRSARNPAVVPGGRGFLDVSQGIRVLEVPSFVVDRSQGDIHPEGNPHYWLDPRNGLMVAGQIAGRLVELEPEKAGLFRANLAAFEREMKVRIEDWEKRLAPFRGRQIASYHKQWEYLADWLGLEIAGYVEEKPGVPPSPRHLAGLMERMRAQRVPVLLCADFTPEKIPRQVAERTGARLLLLPPSVEEGEYGDLFERLVSRLEEAFAAGVAP
jgi:zinc/manganese transport system substrate-binding protein